MIHVDLGAPRWWQRRWLVTVTAERPEGSRFVARIRCRQTEAEDTVRRLVQAARIWINDQEGPSACCSSGSAAK